MEVKIQVKMGDRDTIIHGLKSGGGGALMRRGPVQIKLPLAQIQYLREVLGFHSMGDN